MRFATPRSAASVIRDLAESLDRAGQPIAETCRQVGDAAVRAGLQRPSYANVRRLVLAERARRKELAEVRAELVSDLVAGRVPHFVDTATRLREAAARRPVEPRVSETQGFEGEAPRARGTG